MIARTFRLACPLDCFDACGLLARVADGRVVRLTGDPAHPFTAGRICTKGKQLAVRRDHPDRLRRPLLRCAGRLEPVSWDTALDWLAEVLARVRRELGPAAVLHYAGSGHTGLAKTADRVFFNHFGGVTVPRGSLCWGAGLAAQRYDFGRVFSHAPADLANARLIVVWGRNPVHTSPHLAPILAAARRRGAPLVVVDPIRTRTAAMADLHLAPHPGTDGALALGLARRLIAEGNIDTGYLRRHVLGFQRFRRHVDAFPPERVAAVTGVPPDLQERLAELYGTRRPAALVVGYGVQRYTNGGNSVRCIDALGALTGNIGRAGGGVSYANRDAVTLLGAVEAASRRHARRERTFPVARFADFVASAADPPVAAVVVARANPLVQLPDSRRAAAAFDRIPHKVVIDTFLTDTAARADLVLPATSVLEEDDLVFSGMHSPVVCHSEAALAPPEGMIGEFDLYRLLARRLGLDTYPDVDRRTFLEMSIAPLTEATGTTLDDLRRAYAPLPAPAVPWADGRFATPSGRYELYSERAAADGLPSLPSYLPPRPPPAPDRLRLLTPHARESMHSQHFAFRTERPTARVHPETLDGQGLADGAAARLAADAGEIDVTLHADPAVPRGTVAVYQGWWHRSGCVNTLTSALESDMGELAAYNDNFCCILTGKTGGLYCRPGND